MRLSGLIRSAARSVALRWLILAVYLVALFAADELPINAAAIWTPTGVFLDTQDAIRLEQVADGFDRPTAIATDGSAKLFVTEQAGTIRVIEAGKASVEPFLDLTDQVRVGIELGLLGLAFHPEFAETGRLYVTYSDPDRTTVLSEWTVLDDGIVDVESERVLLTIAQDANFHKGGGLAFGPDGLLYMGVGDDEREIRFPTPQLDTLFGSVILVDVDGRTGGLPYGIPPDNPYASGGGRPELFDIGLRNPWRLSFDPETGDLWIADVGLTLREEVNRHPAGEPPGINFGWSTMEGSQCRLGPCAPEGLTRPVAEYLSSGAGRGDCAIIGGYVYGLPAPDIGGHYLFADHCSGRIWTVDAQTLTAKRLMDTELWISTFGVDDAGQVYLADYRGGGIYRISDETPGPEQ